MLFVGAGATGGYFGGRLAEAGKDVTFLVRPGRAAHLAERGLRLRAPGGDDTVLKPRTVTAGAIDGRYDVVVLAVKAYALEQAMADLAPAVGPETVIVPLLNGMRHVEALIGAFGEERVYGGVCMIHATLDDAGDVVQLTGLHRLNYGPLDGDDDGRLDAVAGALSGAEFDSSASRTIVQDMWEKWMFLASLGAATTLMRASIGDINAAPGGPGFTARIAAEAAAVATAAGYPPREGAVQFLRAGVSSTARTTSSIYRDMIRGGPVEADAVLGDFVTQAERNGVAVPLLSAAYTGLSIYQAARPARASATATAEA
jgi:2-dehydropantoate 2-reductase